jgi:hypothetical protein
MKPADYAVTMIERALIKYIKIFKICGIYREAT